MTYAELLGRYTDFERLTLPPQAGEGAGCFSSYDRRSAYDEQTERYVAWGANDDGSGYMEKLADGSIVAMEMDGPGVLVRTWSALPGKGHIRIFIDHAPRPAVDVPFADFFDRYGDEIPPMNFTSLVFAASRGRNSWLPVPFQCHIRIELAPDWGMFYQFTYVRMKKETVLPSPGEMYERAGQTALAALDRTLYRRLRQAQGERALTDRCSVTLAPGETKELFSSQGAGVIRRLQLLPGGELSGLRLTMYWDGQAEPAVDVLLPHFFGQSTSLAQMGTVVSGVSEHACYANWHMPFSEGFSIRLTNLSQETRSLEAAVGVQAEAAQEMRARLRFHAKTHAGFFAGRDGARFAPGGDRWPDWPVLLTKGAGRFCGMQLHVHNTWTEPEEAPPCWFNGKWDKKNVDWWWGEGDEKFFVDGEKFPSTFGTGSEDYFGYAWAAEPPFPVFDAPYAAMDMPLSGNGETSAVRYHIADDVPFMQEFEAYMEKYKPDSWEHDGVCRYTATAFFYLQADARDGYPGAEEAYRQAVSP